MSKNQITNCKCLGTLMFQIIFQKITINQLNNHNNVCRAAMASPCLLMNPYLPARHLRLVTNVGQGECSWRGNLGFLESRRNRKQDLEDAQPPDVFVLVW